MIMPQQLRIARWVILNNGKKMFISDIDYRGENNPMKTFAIKLVPKQGMAGGEWYNPSEIKTVIGKNPYQDKPYNSPTDLGVASYQANKSGSIAESRQPLEKRGDSDKRIVFQFLKNSNLTRPITRESIFSFLRNNEEMAIKWGGLTDKEKQDIIFRIRDLKLKSSMNESKKGYCKKCKKWKSILPTGVCTGCSIEENINIDVNKGDTVLVGRFKNKPIKVKDIGKDDHGMPTINGRKATTFRIKKDEKNEMTSFKEIIEQHIPEGYILSRGRDYLSKAVGGKPIDYHLFDKIKVLNSPDAAGWEAKFGRNIIKDGDVENIKIYSVEFGRDPKAPSFPKAILWRALKDYESIKEIDGGLAKSKGISEKDVDFYEFLLGLKTEKEHTDNIEVLRKTALDHLAEDPHYYTKLKKAGLEENTMKTLKKLITEAYGDRGWIILPIGVVDIESGKNDMLNNVYDTWKTDEDIVIVKKEDGKFYGIWGGAPSVTPNMRVELKHDQTGKRMGSAVVIKVVHYSTVADLPKFKQDVKNTISQRTIRSAVFK